VRTALKGIESTYESHAKYPNHVGPIKEMEELMHNKSTWRKRGYNIGSLYTTPEEKDQYYKQTGHPLSEDSERGTFPPDRKKQEYTRKGFETPNNPDFDFEGPLKNLGTK